MAPLTTVTICVSETRARGRARGADLPPDADRRDPQRASTSSARPRAPPPAARRRSSTVGRLAAPQGSADARARARRRSAGAPTARVRRRRAATGRGVEAELRAPRARASGRARRRPRRRAGAAGARRRVRALERVRGRAALDPRGDGRGAARWSPPTSAASRSWSWTARRACSCPPRDPAGWRRRWRACSTTAHFGERLGAAGRARARERFDLRGFSGAPRALPRELARREGHLAVAQPAIGVAQRQRRVVPASELRLEVEQPVARVDLPAAKRQAIRRPGG